MTCGFFLFSASCLLTTPSYLLGLFHALLGLLLQSLYSRSCHSHPSSFFHAKSFAINLASTMLGYVIHNGGRLTANQDLGIKVATPIGTFCGQLLFGWLADVYGRKRMYGIGQFYHHSFSQLSSEAYPLSSLFTSRMIELISQHIRQWLGL